MSSKTLATSLLNLKSATRFWGLAKTLSGAASAGTTDAIERDPFAAFFAARPFVPLVPMLASVWIGPGRPEYRRTRAGTRDRHGIAISVRWRAPRRDVIYDE